MKTFFYIHFWCVILNRPYFDDFIFAQDIDSDVDDDDDVGDDCDDEDDMDDDDQKRPIQTLQWWKPSLANLCNIPGSERVTTYTFSAGSQNDFLFKKWINFSLEFWWSYFWSNGKVQ